MNATGWSRGLEVTGGGTGVVSHAGLVLLRQFADRTGLTPGLSAALPSPDGGLDRGRVFTDLACAIADGARVISDFRVMGDQEDVFGRRRASAPAHHPGVLRQPAGATLSVLAPSISSAFHVSDGVIVFISGASFGVLIVGALRPRWPGVPGMALRYCCRTTRTASTGRLMRPTARHRRSRHSGRRAGPW